MHKYANAFAEVNCILQYLDEEDYEKIPKELIKVIEQNRNKNYEYEMNDEIDLEKQEMLVETKALLFNIFRDYLATTEQKEKIIKMQKEDMEKIRKRKSAEYEKAVNKKVVFEKADEKENNKVEELSLTKVEKESLWKKLLNKILKKHK